jgi:hypothetical protein
MGITVEWTGVNELSASLTSAPDDIRARIRVTLRDLQLDLLASIKGKLEGSYLQRRSGTLSRSFQAVPLVESSTEIKAEIISSNVDYGWIQEMGGTITPKSGTYLTVPLASMLTPRGLAKGSARDVIDNPSAFGFTGVFFGSNILFGVRSGPYTGGRSRQPDMEPLFALKRSVTIPAHFYVRDSIQQLEATFGDRMLEATKL